MDKAFSSATLEGRQGEVKAAAREGLAHIIENSARAFAPCPGEVFQREIDDVAGRALYVARVEEAVLRGRAAAREGHTVEGIRAARAEATRRRATRS